MLRVVGIVGILVFIVCCCFVSCKEPQCSSFHYEEKLLEKMIRTEIKVEDLINTISQVEQRVNDSLEKMTESLQTEKSRLNDVHTSVTTAFKKSAATVAFNVYDAADHDLAENEIIIFTKTIINHGDGYNTATGKFTAPVDGLYFFSTSLCSTDGKFLNFAISNDTDNLLVSSHYDDSMSCGSASVFALLKTGDHVWVKSTSTQSNQLYTNIYRRNTFTGALIQRG